MKKWRCDKCSKWTTNLTYIIDGVVDGYDEWLSVCYKCWKEKEEVMK